MICAFSALLLFALSASTPAEFTMSGPEEARTTEEILACAEKDDVQGGLRAKAYVSSAEYRTPEQRAFAAWYSPYSGRAACHVYLYIHDTERDVWVRKLARAFDGTPQVSVEFGTAITIRNADGEVIHRHSAE